MADVRSASTGWQRFWAIIRSVNWHGVGSSAVSILVTLTCASLLWKLWVGQPPELSTPARPPVSLSQHSRPPRPEPPLPTEPVALDGAEVSGRPTAKVVLIEYTDFECPFCGAFERTTLPTIQSEYVDTGKVRLAVRNLPLSSIHRFAAGAAIAADCAGQQGRFWEMKQRLFGDQQHLDGASLASAARDIGLDMRRFGQCTASGTSPRLNADEQSAHDLGITATPTFLIGTTTADGRVHLLQRSSGVIAVAKLSRELDDAIAK